MIVKVTWFQMSNADVNVTDVLRQGRCQYCKDAII